MSQSLLDPWVPDREEPFDLAAAGHLLRRASLGASLRQRRRCVRQGLEATLDDVLNPSSDDGVDRLLDDVIALGDAERVRSYRVWRLLNGSARLRERLSLLWHGHFACSNTKVMSPSAMARQLDLFDRSGMGVFDDLALGVARDPAMLRYLDGDANVAGSPNENFARELLELFTLGIGNYTEGDVQDGARAFTGWQARDGAFWFNPRHHDGGVKHVLGASGPFGGEDVVRLAVQQPASARFIASRLLAWFVHPEPAEGEIEALAACYTAEGRHIGRTLAVLLRSKLFFSHRARRSRLSSPLEHLVIVVRSLGCRAAPAPLAALAAALGESLLEPPSVAGWPKGREWIHPTAWRLRSNGIAELLAGAHGGVRPAPESLLEGDGARRARTALSMLMDADVDRETLDAVVEFARSPAGSGSGGASALCHMIAVLPTAWMM